MRTIGRQIDFEGAGVFGSQISYHLRINGRRSGHAAESNDRVGDVLWGRICDQQLTIAPPEIRRGFGSNVNVDGTIRIQPPNQVEQLLATIWFVLDDERRFGGLKGQRRRHADDESNECRMRTMPYVYARALLST